MKKLFNKRVLLSRPKTIISENDVFTLVLASNDCCQEVQDSVGKLVKSMYNPANKEKTESDDKTEFFIVPEINLIGEV